MLIRVGLTLIRVGLTLVEHYKTDATIHSCVEASALKRNLHDELISSW